MKLFIRTVKDQVKTAARFPDSEALRHVLAASLERLRAAVGGR
jgi:hypothetical protein